MEEIRFEIKAGEAGVRIDKCIANKLSEDYSRTYVKFLMENGFVLVNGKAVKPKYISKTEDEIILSLAPLPKDEAMGPEDIPLDIIFEDEHLIVVNKPPGMVVHPAAGNWSGTLINALLFHCGKLAECDNELRPGVVHRLDKDTTGVMVIAKNDRAMRLLAKQFQKRKVKKKYVVLVRGRVEMDNGLIEAPVGRHPVNRKKMAVNVEGAREARTVYHVIKRFRNFTQLEVCPETGRMHQIRVHMEHIGYPVLGDNVYGRDRKLERQALHAEMLGFTHPDSGKYVEFHAPVPDDMRKFIEEGEK